MKWLWILGTALGLTIMGELSLAGVEKNKPVVMETRVFRVPPDFMSVSGGAPAASQDPMGHRPRGPQSALDRWHTFLTRAEPRSAKEILEGQGIPFPPGSSAMYHPGGALTVTNTPAHLDLVEVFVAWTVREGPGTVAFTAHLVQAPRPLMRLLASNATQGPDQTADLQRLLDEADKGDPAVQVLHTAFVETKPGQRCSVGSITEHQYTASLELDAKGRARTEGEMQPLGFQLEIDPTVDQEARFIDVNVRSRLALLGEAAKQMRVTEPVSGNPLTLSLPVFQIAEVPVPVRMRSGHTRLLGIWPAKGAGNLPDQDLCQGVFLTAHVVARVPSGRVNTPFPKTVKGEGSLMEDSFDLPGEFFSVNPELTNENLMEVLGRNGLRLPPGSEVRVDEREGQQRLVIRTTPEMLLVAELWVAGYVDTFPKTCHFKVEVIRAPAKLLRKLIQAAAGQSDHSAALQALHGAVANHEARQMTQAYLECKPGDRSFMESILNRQEIMELSWQNDQQPAWDTEMRPVGLSLEMDPTVSALSSIIDVDYALRCHTSPPTPWKERLPDPASRRVFDRPVDAFHVAEVQTANAFQDGTVKIIGLWRPVGAGGDGGEDVLEAAFMTCRVVRHATRFKPIAKAPPEAAAAGEKPAEMVTRIFQVNPGFPDPRPSAWGADPFAESPASEVRRKASEEMLKAQGIPFPAGAAVITQGAATNQLIVKNTEANLALVETEVKKFNAIGGHQVGVTVHLLEAPAAVVEKMLAEQDRKDDCLSAMNSLLGEAGSGMRSVATVHLQTRQGNSSVKVAQTRPMRMLEGIGMHEGVPKMQWTEVGVGTQLGVESVVDDDGLMVDLEYEFEHHPAPPVTRVENLAVENAPPAEISLTDFYREKVGGNLSLMSGTGRILAVWKPLGRAEFGEKNLLHLAILEAHILPEE